MSVRAFKSRSEAAGFWLLDVPVFLLTVGTFALVDKLLQLLGKDLGANEGEHDA